MTDEITSGGFGSTKSTRRRFSEGERAWSGWRTQVMHVGPQGHLYRAEEGADEPVVELGFIAINGRPYMAWKRQASLIGERLLFLIA